MSLKIAICHYRVGETDGVSLEIAKRKRILEKLGCEVKLIAGPHSYRAHFIIKELEWDEGIAVDIKENCFTSFKRNNIRDKELQKKIEETSNKIKKQLIAIQKRECFEAVLIHNIFSFGGNIPVAKAFYEWIEECKILCLATHHDFYWENEEFLAPRNGYIKKFLKRYLPPKSHFIKHIVINSLARKKLKSLNNIQASLMTDIFNFNQPEWTRDNYNKDFLKRFNINPNDLIILQATRIIPRKGIELAFDFAKSLQLKLQQLRKNKLYNGKNLNSRSKVTLLLPGYCEYEKIHYLVQLKAKANKERINVKYITDYIDADRFQYQSDKKYSLWDSYIYADLVTFPSLREGWGNQFIEAVFAQKPIVIFEYPVFKRDIKPEGYHVISLGNSLLRKDINGLLKIPAKNIKKAVKQTANWLVDKQLNEKLEQNFQIGKKYHDYKILENFLVDKLNLD